MVAKAEFAISEKKQDPEINCSEVVNDKLTTWIIQEPIIETEEISIVTLSFTVGKCQSNVAKTYPLDSELSAADFFNAEGLTFPWANLPEVISITNKSDKFVSVKFKINKKEFFASSNEQKNTLKLKLWRNGNFNFKILLNVKFEYLPNQELGKQILTSFY